MIHRRSVLTFSLSRMIFNDKKMRPMEIILDTFFEFYTFQFYSFLSNQQFIWIGICCVRKFEKNENSVLQNQSNL